MSTIEFKSLAKRFGPQTVLKDIDLRIEEGELVVLVGPSGCGKTTLLRVLAGLEPASGGQVLINGQDMTDALPSDRGLAMVFQSYALYPHMTVEENIGFALSLQKVDKAEIKQRVAEVATMLELSHLLDRKPAALSGGQRQRVAIGRAIVKRPKVILFDEPLSNLDAKLRVQMRAELCRLHREFGSTIVYVTHDQVEAMTMAQKIVVLHNGHVAQMGAPMDLYHAPDNTFVAQFIGVPKMNLLPASLHHGVVQLRNGQTVSLDAGFGSADAVQFGIRPEHLRLSAISHAGSSEQAWTVDLVERLGVETFIHLHNSQHDSVVVRQDGDCFYECGQLLQLELDAKRAFLFSMDGARRVPMATAAVA